MAKSCALLRERFGSRIASVIHLAAFYDFSRREDVPWNLALSMAIGVAVMFSRLLFDATGEAADNDHLTGARRYLHGDRAA